MPRRDVIRASLEGRGALIQTRIMEEACEISNRIAPEHLESQRDATRSAGSRCCATPARSSSARFTSESLGDYCAGPNHVLPTSGTARFSSPLGVYDFQKRSSLIEVSEAGAQVLGPIAAELAYGEGLQAHARAAELRLEPRKDRCMKTLAERIRKVDPAGRAVDARLRDPAERRPGQARRDGEPVPPARALQRELGERLGRVAINRYPADCVGDVIAALSAHVDLPAGCKLMLGNGSDELISLLAHGLRRARRRRSWRRCPAS